MTIIHLSALALCYNSFQSVGAGRRWVGWGRGGQMFPCYWFFSSLFPPWRHFWEKTLSSPGLISSEVCKAFEALWNKGWDKHSGSLSLSRQRKASTWCFGAAPAVLFDVPLWPLPLDIFILLLRLLDKVEVLSQRVVRMKEWATASLYLLVFLFAFILGAGFCCAAHSKDSNSRM